MRSKSHGKKRPANGYVLPEEKLQQREKAFAIYREMGRMRSLVALERELKRDHPEIAASRPTLEKWSKQHQWRERVKSHDDAVLSNVAAVTNPVMDPNFDQINALLSAAHLAMVKLQQGGLKASEMKALVDMSANAIKLAESIKQQQGSKEGEEQVVAEMGRILDLVEARRRKDADQLLARIAELEARLNGTQVDPAAQVQVDGVDIEPSTEVQVEQAAEPEPEKKPVIVPAVSLPATLPRFAASLSSSRCRNPPK